jgi:nitrogen-specific signal transduction histidine kinase
MQAPLSSTASGKFFRTGPLTSRLRHQEHVQTGGGMSEKVEPGKIGSTGRWIGEFSPSSVANRKSNLHSVSEGIGLAHDAGNLLGALGLYCELLALPGVLRIEHRHYAEELQQLSGRSRELIDRLLNPGKAQSRGQQLDSSAQGERTALADVIEDCRGLLSSVARRGVEVAYEAGAALPIAVSRESLERILINLTKNAAEAAQRVENASDGPAITIRVSGRRDGTEPAQIVLTVEDTGCGMSAATVKALLGEERKSVSEMPGPRGIGFHVVRELVKASGGQLQITSRSGVGTIVAIAWAVASPAETSSVETVRSRKQSSSRRDSCGTVANALEERRRLMAMTRNGQLERLSC